MYDQDKLNSLFNFAVLQQISDNDYISDFLYCYLIDLNNLIESNKIDYLTFNDIKSNFERHFLECKNVLDYFIINDLNETNHKVCNFYINELEKLKIKFESSIDIYNKQIEYLLTFK